MFVIRTECKRAISGHKDSVVTKDGEKVWVVKEPDGGVEATSRSVYFDSEPPQDYKTFATYEAAEKFIKCWKGHPWYYTPNGNYEIIEVEQKYKQVADGFQKK